MIRSREMEVAEEAARVGGAIATGYFREKFAVFTKESGPGKSSYNLVSQADLDSERAIVAVRLSRVNQLTRRSRSIAAWAIASAK